jgi:hypothetical protein
MGRAGAAARRREVWQEGGAARGPQGRPAGNPAARARRPRPRLTQPARARSFFLPRVPQTHERKRNIFGFSGLVYDGDAKPERAKARPPGQAGLGLGRGRRPR